MDGIYVGQMSGTSMDGVDTAVVRFRDQRMVEILKTSHQSFPESVRQSVEALFESPDRHSPLASHVDAKLAECYAEAAHATLAGESHGHVVAIGCHGQTIIHCPNANPPYSWQAGDPLAVASLTGIPVVADFRTADMEAGGQGAPLAPAFHSSQFAQVGTSRVIVNIGGISNITCLPSDPSANVIGFDTGPGNSLSDQWIRQELGCPYDDQGRRAASASPDQALLELLLGDPYFEMPPPKSLDARHFNMKRLAEAIAASGSNPSSATVQSTLAAFTADAIAQGIEQRMPDVDEIYVCGGGALNCAMLERLRERSAAPVQTTGALGISPEYVEAVAFAWLACCHRSGQPSNLPSVTGARDAVVLGRVWNPQNDSDRRSAT